MPEELIYCYNKGCGQQFKEKDNNKDSCTYHPGIPVFHDAYKGWSCCKKKCTDFTEFLNIKGCTVSFHSNEKPPEPVKPIVDKLENEEVIVVRAPVPEKLPRPPFDAPLITMKPNIAPTLIEQITGLSLSKPTKSTSSGDILIDIGTCCKHGGCKVEYKGPDVSLDHCDYHPGSPVFHEGLKFWSCCKKRTTDFTEFLAQVGCVRGDHQWVQDEGVQSKPVCRQDWHQTGNFVVISIYAKKYDPNRSFIKLNAIRAIIELIFPADGTEFSMDIELRGIIDVEKSEVNMLSTKVEVKLRKAEPGSWSTLDFPREKPMPIAKPEPINDEIYDDDPVDLNEIQ